MPGGVVVTSNATMDALDLGNYPTYVHDTHALWMWGAGDGSLVSWTIPAGKREASAFKWLSLRIGQTSGAPANDLRVQLQNGNVWSPELRLTDYGPLPHPTQLCGSICAVPRDMATIRVPLSAFGTQTMSPTCVWSFVAIRSPTPSLSTISRSRSGSSSPDSWSRTPLKA